MPGGVGPVDADRHVVEVGVGRTIALRLHVSVLTSLFQHVGGTIRNLRNGSFKEDCGSTVLSRFAAMCPPIEILRWGEYVPPGTRLASPRLSNR